MNFRSYLKVYGDYGLQILTRDSLSAVFGNSGLNSKSFSAHYAWFTHGGSHIYIYIYIKNYRLYQIMFSNFFLISSALCSYMHKEK